MARVEPQLLPEKRYVRISVTPLHLTLCWIFPCLGISKSFHELKLWMVFSWSRFDCTLRRNEPNNVSSLKPVENNLTKLAQFFQLDKIGPIFSSFSRFRKAVFICLNLGHRLVITEDFLRYFWNCLRLEFNCVDLQCPPISSHCTGSFWKKINHC